tara:strand:- start:6342 stop:7049 length:708 start_codon:yes stop_codon:yes gene_type:complete
MFEELWLMIFHYLKLIVTTEVLWNILPLAVATIVILAYFERYSEEEKLPGWNTYVANSLVLLFVSISLLRHIYSIDGFGAANFLEFQAKSLASVFLLFIGMLFLRFNFEHILPERFARHLSSPLTVNLVAFAIILYVFSPLKFGLIDVFALIIILLVLLLVLNLFKFIIQKIFVYVRREKKKEELKNAKEQKFQIDELKRQLRVKEKLLRKAGIKEAEDTKERAGKVKKILLGRK